MKKFWVASLLVATSVVLGATVFREPVAWAAQTVDSHVTNLDGNGDIKVHEQGTARVEVQGSPHVSLGDSEQHPLWVRDVDAPTRPFQTQFFFQGDGVTHQTVDVPGDMTFVLEYVDASAFITDPNVASAIAITTVAGGLRGVHSIAFQAGVNPDGYAAAQPVRIYADPGTQVEVSYPVSSAAVESVGTVNLSGHFVPTG